MKETAFQRFLRNHQENIHLMKVAKTLAERDGDTDRAAIIQAMIDTWESIAEKAKEGGL